MPNASDRSTLAGFSKRAVIVAIIALLAGSAAYFFWVVGHGILVAFAAMLFAILLDGIGRIITRFIPMPRTLAILTSVAIIGVVLLGGFTAGGTRVVEQAPQLQQTIQKELNQLQHFLKEKGINTGQLLGSGSSASSSMGKMAISKITHYASVPIGIVADLVVIIVAGVYFAARPRTYLNSVVRLFPPAKQSRMREVFFGIGFAMRRWFAGRILAMIVIGVLVTVGLLLMGVQLAFLLGFIAGVLTFVPYLGAVVSAIPAILVGLLQGPLTALYVALLFLVAHILEGYILIPFIQERQVSMAPGYLILAQLLGGLIAGVMGVLLATPIAVTITIAVQTLYLEDVLGEKVHILGQK